MLIITVTFIIITRNLNTVIPSSIFTRNNTVRR